MPTNRPLDDAALTVATSVDDAIWLVVVPDAEQVCERAVAAAVTAAPTAARIAGEASVLLADDDMLRELNRRYRGIDKPTNVLAFAALEADMPAAPAEPVLLGDIAIARETVVREASDASKSVTDHLCHMVVHGMLHLLGFDHQTPAEADEMEAIEIRALATLGIADPYEGDTEAASPADKGR